MVPLWIIAITLYMMCPARSVDFFRPSFLSVRFGECISLICPFGHNQRTESVIWYKQSVGEMPRKIGERIAYKEVKFSPEFKNSGFIMEMTDNGISLTIPNIKKDHEGLYYCGKLFTLENVTLSNGTFLAVSDDRDVKVSVWQRGVSDSVPAGASVTLQCSVLSESRAAELQVLWFRAAPPQSHPQIIYTHHNSSHQCESDSSTHTCVYNFSKNILSLNDTGTYYCAVLLCGKIIFGNGTPVQMQNVASYNPVVICQGTALVMCGILISVQTVLLCKRKNGPQHRERIQHDAVINTDETNTQVDDGVELNYAALHFNERKIKRVRGNRGPSHDSVYSEVKHSTISHIK
ncbi:uncharacterized protein LOC113646044 isoform X2 [Tachysurus fulvidraco]|uniref:uncharacterized protein LOC113646044 isoform X2 n=1 Tax=Tachysurus fulvidraco TaxID=1234273 RepID=UPI001FEFF8B5|nr:uncharacterized protein LOC113646044 isoform X2 [Tachysurus fulvidraco]